MPKHLLTNKPADTVTAMSWVKTLGEGLEVAIFR